MTRLLSDLQDPDVQSYLENAEIPTILVPIGTTEQHGAHLCLGTDSLLTTDVCK